MTTTRPTIRSILSAIGHPKATRRSKLQAELVAAGSDQDRIAMALERAGRAGDPLISNAAIIRKPPERYGDVESPLPAGAAIRNGQEHVSFQFPDGLTLEATAHGTLHLKMDDFAVPLDAEHLTDRSIKQLRRAYSDWAVSPDTNGIPLIGFLGGKLTSNFDLDSDRARDDFERIVDPPFRRTSSNDADDARLAQTARLLNSR